jgi:hypothetical protein
MHLETIAPPDAAEARATVARHLAELQKLHVVLATDSQSLKTFSANGAGVTEIRLGYELLEQYLAMTEAFLENMHGRFEARLGVLRRAEPQVEGKPGHAERAPGHTQFWLEFSRLTSVLRRIAKRVDR